MYVSVVEPSADTGRMREEQHQQVMRRRQEMEREAAVALLSKKTVAAGSSDSVSCVGVAGSTQKLDELVARQNNAPDDLADKQKLRSVLYCLSLGYLY